MTHSGDLTDRTCFPLWAREAVRYCDTDRQGHVNNAIFATYFESGEMAWLGHPGAALIPPGCSYVTARLLIDYRREILWPDVVDIGTVVLAMGKSSLTIGHGLFAGEHCVATGEDVLVLTDNVTRRPVPLPEDVRLRLAGASLKQP
jgi:acyl-CoA thioester hydrolase